jgi:hypothetical protein
MADEMESIACGLKHGAEQRDLIVQAHRTVARPRRSPAGSVQVDG